MPLARFLLLMVGGKNRLRPHTPQSFIAIRGQPVQLGFSANIATLLSLSSHYKLSRAFNALARAALPVLAVAAVAMNAVFSVAPAAGQSNKVNAPPVITAPGDKTYEQGETITPFGITVTDPDGDTVTVGVSGLPEGLSYAAGKVRGTVADDATPQDYSVTVTANDGSSPAVEAAFTITVTKKPPPEPPRFRRTRMSRGVEENMPPGSPVGNPVAATGGSGNFTYSLSGTDAALFEINPATGQLTTAAGVSFDYEDQSRYSVTVTVTDGDLGVDVTAYITVKVRDVDEPPVIAALNDHTYEQGQTIQPITIEVNDPDNDTVTVGVSGHRR